MQPYATDGVSLGSAEEPYDSDMTHSYRLTEGRLIRYPLIHIQAEGVPMRSVVESVALGLHSSGTVMLLIGDCYHR